jgi:L-alanine-DL-glutamate epimerase-like enolase superfamily enzyme
MTALLRMVRSRHATSASPQAFTPLVVGRSLEGIQGDMHGFWRGPVRDSRLRWLGQEKGVVHLVAAAVVNAVWDLCAKHAGKPLWQLLVDMTPEEARRVWREGIPVEGAAPLSRAATASGTWPQGASAPNCYIRSIIARPNPEDETSVAPSSMRAKSYVTIFSLIVSSSDEMIRSAASRQPR